MISFEELKQAVMEKSRKKKIEDFYALCTTESEVLDVGVSDNDHSPQVNLFLKRFKFPGRFYTGLAVQPMGKVARQYPDKRFVVYDGRDFPFKDGEFGYVFSNAVVEHVGSIADQIHFVNEMIRVARYGVFFTTPNKFFPIESHTNTMFLHWFDSYFYKWCERNSPYWTPKNLKLLGSGDLKRLMRESSSTSYLIKPNRMLGLTMTYSVICRL